MCGRGCCFCSVTAALNLLFSSMGPLGCHLFKSHCIDNFVNCQWSPSPLLYTAEKTEEQGNETSGCHR